MALLDSDLPLLSLKVLLGIAGTAWMAAAFFASIPAQAAAPTTSATLQKDSGIADSVAPHAWQIAVPSIIPAGTEFPVENVNGAEWAGPHPPDSVDLLLRITEGRLQGCRLLAQASKNGNRGYIRLENLSCDTPPEFPLTKLDGFVYEAESRLAGIHLLVDEDKNGQPILFTLSPKQHGIAVLTADAHPQQVVTEKPKTKYANDEIPPPPRPMTR